MVNLSNVIRSSETLIYRDPRVVPKKVEALVTSRLPSSSNVIQPMRLTVDCKALAISEKRIGLSLGK